MLKPLVRTMARVLAAGESGSPCLTHIYRDTDRQEIHKDQDTFTFSSHCNPYSIQIDILASIFSLLFTLAAMVPGPLLTLCGSSACIPEYPCGLGGASSSLILSTDSLLRCGVLANDGSQELDLAQSCNSRLNNETVFQLCISSVSLEVVQLNTEAVDLAYKLVGCMIDTNRARQGVQFSTTFWWKHWKTANCKTMIVRLFYGMRNLRRQQNTRSKEATKSQKREPKEKFANENKPSS